MTSKTKTFKKTAKQIEAINLMSERIEVLLEGGSRSGKTFINCYAIIARALKHENSHHLIIRKHFNHIKQSIWYQTLPDVLNKAFSDIKVKSNKSDWFLEFENGSQIWIAGTDDKERIEKILGSEWDTIYINEASQIPYDTYEVLKTRLNPKQEIKPLLLIDYNPPSKNHWGFKVFHEGVNPESGLKLKNPDRYGMLKINPGDNQRNLSDSYIETLESMSEKKQRRFLFGEYSDDSERALWKRDWIANNRITSEIKDMANDLRRVVIAVDPAVTGLETSDDTGIIAAGTFMFEREIHYVILGDHTYHGDVTGWGEEVVRVYNKWQADRVVGEVNQGGDLVQMNIRNYGTNIKFDSVRATRGKAVRAEPVADLYRRGYVHHLGVHTDLEDQMCTWTPEDPESPDNMDAMVWAISYLAGFGNKQASITMWG